MAFNIYDFMSEKDYIEVCKSLKSKETKVIYSDNTFTVLNNLYNNTYASFVWD